MRRWIVKITKMNQEEFSLLTAEFAKFNNFLDHFQTEAVIRHQQVINKEKIIIKLLKMAVDNLGTGLQNDLLFLFWIAKEEKMHMKVFI